MALRHYVKYFGFESPNVPVLPRVHIRLSTPRPILFCHSEYLMALHTVVEKLNTMFEENQEDQHIDDYIRLIYDMAVISEGGKIDNPGDFSRMVGHMMPFFCGE